jgi:nicotinamidase-related amidase
MSLQIAANAYDFPHDGNLTSGNTALIVIDMQVDFCGVGGMTTVSGTDLDMMRAPSRRSVASTHPSARHRTAASTICSSRTARPA